LSKARHKSAKQLSKAITQALASLSMGDAEVRVQVSSVTSEDSASFELSLNGIDKVEFLIAPNRGEAVKPLAKIASGGELSRALLAIKSVLNQLGSAGLYVFDEVDAGVGGAVAEVIGRKVKEVSRHRQVICITHLSQIAAFADQHFRVQKQTVKGRTVSTIEHLQTPPQVLDELARMLGGIRVSDKTRAAAAELLRDAQSS